MLHQTSAVCAWNFRSIANRFSSVLVVVTGFFAVVLVLSTVLAVRDGIARSAARPGAEGIASVTARNGALSPHALDLVKPAPGVARDADGPLVAGTVITANLIRDWRPGTLGIAVVFGIDGKRAGVLPNFRILGGRLFRPGLDELMIGKGALRIYPEYAPGRTMQWHHRKWTIVGVFATGSNVQDSEFLADLHQTQDVIGKGDVYSGVLAKLDSPASFESFKKRVEREPGMAMKVQRLSEQDSDMGQQFTLILTLAAIVITALMAVGAIFAALNIMYANVESRSGELAILRALGFSRGPVLLSMLLEAMVLALIGGILGVVAAAAIFDGFQASTIMGARQVAFEFAVTPSAVISALMLTLGMGFLGGLFPAIRAARRPIAAALREE